MVSLVLTLALGVVSGYLLRHKSRISKVPVYIHLVVCVMLFLLGMSVGLNKLIMSNLSYYCGQAALISSFSILGSVLASLALYQFCFRKGGKL